MQRWWPVVLLASLYTYKGGPDSNLFGQNPCKQIMKSAFDWKYLLTKVRARNVWPREVPGSREFQNRFKQTSFLPSFTVSPQCLIRFFLQFAAVKEQTPAAAAAADDVCSSSSQSALYGVLCFARAKCTALPFWWCSSTLGLDCECGGSSWPHIPCPGGTQIISALECSMYMLKTTSIVLVSVFTLVYIWMQLESKWKGYNWE